MDDGRVPDEQPQHRVLSLGWWLRDRKGRLIVGQWPNPALWVWLIAALIRSVDLLPAHDRELVWAGRGALIAWALDELVRGVNPFRRLLGAVVLAVQIALFA